MPPFLGNDKYNSTLTSAWNASPADTTMSVSSVPLNVPTIITAGYDTDDETVFSVTGTSGGNTLTGVTRLRGANTDLPQGTTIEVLNNEEFWNQYASAVFTQEGISSLLYGIDGGSTDSYAITLSVAPTDYSDITGVPIVFKANTANTGAATINVNGLGAKAIKKNGTSDLSDNDIKATQLAIVVYDGTNFQLLSSIANVSISQSGAEIYAADAGSTDAYAITLSPTPTAYTTGMTVRFRANTANTGAATLSVNALGAKTIKKNHDQDLADNDIEAGQIVEVTYDGTDFQMLSPTAGVSTSPSFHVYRGTSNQTGGFGLTETKLQFNTEVFDSNSNFDSTTDFRFTPTVAGKYLLSTTVASVGGTPPDQTQLIAHIYKNGASFARTIVSQSGTGALSVAVTVVVDANGSSDYFEVFGVTSDVTAVDLLAGSTLSYFSGCKIG